MEGEGVLMTTAVRVSGYYTRNLGNFENAKIGYEIESDDIREGENIDDFKNRLQSKINKWVQEGVEAADREAAARG
jgi:hypothetical protein